MTMKESAGSITLEALGVKPERVLELVVDRMLEMSLEHRLESTVLGLLNKRIDERVEHEVTKLGDEHVLPKVDEMIEGIALQRTNEWGEKVGKPKTFIEYLIERAEAWMVEDVNFEGKTRGQDSYCWNKNTTRIAYMIDRHLQYAIESAMKKALEDANSKIVGGIEEACRMQLAELSKMMSVSVTKKKR